MNRYPNPRSPPQRNPRLKTEKEKLPADALGLAGKATGCSRCGCCCRQRTPPHEPLAGGAPTLGWTHAPTRGPWGVPLPPSRYRPQGFWWKRSKAERGTGCSSPAKGWAAPSARELGSRVFGGERKEHWEEGQAVPPAAGDKLARRARELLPPSPSRQRKKGRVGESPTVAGEPSGDVSAREEKSLHRRRHSEAERRHRGEKNGARVEGAGRFGRLYTGRKQRCTVG
jgi:hypothetical protein